MQRLKTPRHLECADVFDDFDVFFLIFSGSERWHETGELRDAGRGKPDVTDTQQGGSGLGQVFWQRECWVGWMIWRYLALMLFSHFPNSDYFVDLSGTSILETSIETCSSRRVSLCLSARRGFHTVHFCIGGFSYPHRPPESARNYKKLIAQLRIAEVCFLAIFTVAACPRWTNAHTCSHLHTLRCRQN